MALQKSQRKDAADFVFEGDGLRRNGFVVCLAKTSLVGDKQVIGEVFAYHKAGVLPVVTGINFNHIQVEGRAQRLTQLGREYAVYQARG